MSKGSMAVVRKSGSAVTGPNEVPLPSVLVGHENEHIKDQVQAFYASIAHIFERWVARSPSLHTQRSYRKGVLSFMEFMGWPWPREPWRLVTATISDIAAWRDLMVGCDRAPKTINHRLAAVSAFYKFLAGCAAEARLPIVVPNPAHVQFISRLKNTPVHETLSLNESKARQLLSAVTGESVMDYQDRAMLKVLLYTGIRINTLRLLNIADFHPDEVDSTLAITEKGGDRRTIGIHIVAANALRDHIACANLSSGPLFRAQAAPSKSHTLSKRRASLSTLWRRITYHLAQVPGAVVREPMTDDQGNLLFENGYPVEVERCLYSPHSLRATTATLLLNAGVDIAKVQELLGHKLITTTMSYDKRRRTTYESASHDMPI